MHDSSLESQLEALLSHDASSWVRRATAEYDRVTRGLDQSFVLFGAGRLGRIVLEGLRGSGIEPLAFADNNPTLWGKNLGGVQILSPQDASVKFGGTAAFVTSVYTSAPVRKQLLEMGLRVLSFPQLGWSHPNALLPHGAVDLPGIIQSEAADVLRASGIWGDDISRREYLGQLKWRTSLDSSVLPDHFPPEGIYFPDDLVATSPHEVFVDCGAFDGDSVRAFLQRKRSFLGQIIAIEPDPQNCQNLKHYLATLPETVRANASALQVALGSEARRVRFSATGTAGSAVGDGMAEVDCATLDGILRNGGVATFIKMDVEGAEHEALLGAREVITRTAPVLAICLYHRPEDLWQIPLLIKSLTDQYRLFLRRYSDECWESVCYAIPVDRLAM